jgi:hypothetical protein
MPNKKLQIFVSSTYNDMLLERQAIVEAILMAGHIPAGMELFAAGDKSQLETIRRWIKESDVFMLILGGRYGSLDPDSGKSYIQLEYEYALDQNKPAFAAVMSDSCLDEKVKSQGKSIIEVEHPDLYRSFKKTVLSRVCRFFDDRKDLKLIVHESVPEVTRDRPLAGWVRGDEVLDPKQTLEDMSNLQAENARLVKRVSELEKKLSSEMYGGLSFDELLKILEDERVSVEGIPGMKDLTEAPLIHLFVAFADQLAIGVENFMGMSDTDKYVFYTLAPKLVVYGLAEKKAINNRGVQRFQTSVLGNRFLAKIKPRFRLPARATANATKEASPAPTSTTPDKKGVRRSRKSRPA